MGYELSVSQVGAAEYPLIEVLRDSIFGELGHVFRMRLTEDLQGRQDVLALIAHLEGNPVGYKIGYRFGPGIYYSKSGGVLKDYRRNGLARQMHQWQHGWLRARGYRDVFFNSFARFPGMIAMGLQSGFVPVGLERRSEGDLSIKFVKDLTAPDPVVEKQPAGTVSIHELNADQYGMVAAMASLTGDDLSEEELGREMQLPDARAAVAHLNAKPVGFVYGRRAGDGSFTTTRFDVMEAGRLAAVTEALAGHQKDAARQMGATLARWEARNDATGAIRAAVLAGYQIDGLHHDATKRITTLELSQAVSR